MLANVLKYSEIHAKICAMRSVLLSKSEYGDIASMKTVKEIGRTLKESPDYKHVMDDLAESDLKREPLEKKLFLMFFSDFDRLYGHVPTKKERQYLTDYFRRYETVVVKSLVRILMDERNHDYDLSDYAAYQFRHLTINAKKLVEAKTLDEFIKNLEGTVYYKVFSDIKKNYANPTLLQMESQLDLNCYLQIWKSIKKNLRGETKKGETEINGTDIDMQNILTIFRMKRYFPSESMLMYNYLIPVHFRLKDADIEKLVEAKDEREFFQYLSGTYYGKVYRNFLKTDLSQGYATISARDFERCYYATVQRTAQRHVIRNPYSIIMVTSYLNARHQEIRNITTVIEGVRYQNKPENILKRMIFVKGKESGAAIHD